MSCHGNAAAPTPNRSGTDTLTPLLRVLLVGGPNVGKSTLFNAVTGARQRTMNAPGTTVELATGTWRVAASDVGDRVAGSAAGSAAGSVDQLAERAIIDLPGSYSLLARSADEQGSLPLKTGLHSFAAGQPQK